MREPVPTGFWKGESCIGKVEPFQIPLQLFVSVI